MKREPTMLERASALADSFNTIAAEASSALAALREDLPPGNKLAVIRGKRILVERAVKAALVELRAIEHETEAAAFDAEKERLAAEGDLG